MYNTKTHVHTIMHAVNLKEDLTPGLYIYKTIMSQVAYMIFRTSTPRMSMKGMEGSSLSIAHDIKPTSLQLSIYNIIVVPVL